MSPGPPGALQLVPALAEKGEEPEEAFGAADLPVQPPLDVATGYLHAHLGQFRPRAIEKLYKALRKYEEEARPFSEDTRNSVERQHRKELLRDLRNEIAKLNSRPDTWRVSGGRGKGGIVVRTGHSLSSPAMQRLGYGALVKEVELVGTRLRYQLVKGIGPHCGWVSLHMGDQVLLQHGPQVPPSFLDSYRRPCDSSCSAVSCGFALCHPKEPPRNMLLALMAAHIKSEDRLLRLKDALRTVKQQQRVDEVGDCMIVFAISWHCPRPELQAAAGDVIQEFLDGDKAAMGRVAVEQLTRRSQFQHLWLAREAAEAELRRRAAPRRQDSIWVVFGDDDDLWHPERLCQYLRAIQKHTQLDGVAIFATTSRAIVNRARKDVSGRMPTTVEEVEEHLAKKDAKRLEDSDKCQDWRRQLSSAGARADALLMREDLPLEYFDFCPRLRVFAEFFEVTSPAVVAHRYCDLRFDQFLATYPSCGRECGLELRFFAPDPQECWMYYYACPGVSMWDMEKSIEWGDGLGFIGRNDGHVSSKVEVEHRDVRMAESTLKEFLNYDRNLMAPKLSRYLAAFRNHFECQLIRYHNERLDQRVFDAHVCLAARGAFCGLMFRVEGDRRKSLRTRVRKICQLYGRQVAEKLGVDIFWRDPQKVFQPADDEDWLHWLPSLPPLQ